MASRGQRYSKWMRSRSETWAASASIPFNLSFLKAALKLKFPTIREAFARFRMVVDVTAVNFEIEDQSRMLSRYFVQDLHGEKVNLDGGGVRSANQLLLGAAEGTQITADGTFNIDIPLPGLGGMRRLADGHDVQTPVKEIIDGEITIDTSAAAILTAVSLTSGTIELWTLVEDEEEPSLKTRSRIRQFAATKQEDYYPVDGDLMSQSFHAYAGATTPSYDSAWASGYDQLTCRDLEHFNVRADILRASYRSEADRMPPATTDMVLANKCLAVEYPKWPNKATERRDLISSHVDLGAAPPALSKCVVSCITDRDPEVSARTMGFSSAKSLEDAIAAGGSIKTAKGPGIAVSSLPPSVTRRMPIVLRRPGQ